MSASDQIAQTYDFGLVRQETCSALQQRGYSADIVKSSGSRSEAVTVSAAYNEMSDSDKIIMLDMLGELGR
jgi:hypothetical protein